MDFTFSETRRDPGRDCFIYPAHSYLDRISIESLYRRTETDLLGLLLNGAEEADPFEPHTTRMLVMVEGELVACAELVAYSPLGLPLSGWSALGGLLRRSRRLVQVRRTVVRPEYADRSLPELPHGAVGGLLKGCLQWAVAQDVSDVVMEVAAPRVAERLAQLSATPVEGSRPDAPVATYRLSVNELVARGFRAGSPFYAYLLDYDESVLLHEHVPALA
ncbi:hypothetical protein [Streptomyces sp. CNQ085]|uniref:hypothetical protein n=1 Tax=Streptomyces sp. CNQ085 TaxID=2886944 RepID=UPI001F512359|nr:hypothetical protein [Streptomyces sp. CNQ085]MCI0386805.1 hypothetical protein [Streptomyces sp. CNQ085]